MSCCCRCPCGRGRGATRDLFHWLSAGIGIPAILYAGRVFFASAWGRSNMGAPIWMCRFPSACCWQRRSVYETLTHGVEAWFDGTLMLLLFLLAGRVLDAMMRDRARAGVDALLRQAATGAMVVARDNSVQWLPARDLLAGMVIRVGAGERLAADGVIVAGHTAGPEPADWRERPRARSCGQRRSCGHAQH
jgi:Cu2+-exporting ATPase